MNRYKKHPNKGQYVMEIISQFLGVEVQFWLINACSAHPTVYCELDTKGAMAKFGFMNFLKIKDIIFIAFKAYKTLSRALLFDSQLYMTSGINIVFPLLWTKYLRSIVFPRVT